MLWIKAWHIIFMVAWFAGLFYLPRLFVYHVEARDPLSDARFCVMEKRLYWGITTPAGILTTLFGAWLVTYNLQYYRLAGWMHAKVALVILLWVFHALCGHRVCQFAKQANTHTARYYRVLNEVPTVLLIAIVLLVVLKP